jgi:hypothetical protein
MHIDRRGLLKTAVALTAAGIGCGSPATPRQAAASSLEFEFGGLFGVALWPRKKKAAFLLVSASDAEHVPMLTVPLSSWIPGEGTPEPLVVHAGTETFAAWPLSGFRVWVADFNAGGYDSDQKAAFTYQQPGGWEGLDHLVDLAAVTGEATLPVQKSDLITSMVLVTQGTGGGVQPDLPNERKRWYRFCTSGSDWRQYASQVRVRHPVASQKDTVTLALDSWPHGGNDGRITLDCRGGLRASITNLPARLDRREHFHAFFDLVAKPRVDFDVQEADEKPTNPGRCGRSRGREDAPFIGCIPPLMLQEA